jgi:hypothetical protein
MRTVTPNNNRGGRRWAVAAAGALVFGVLCSVVSAAGAIDRAADAPSAPAVRLHPPTITRALVLGDSALAALNWVPAAQQAVLGFDATLDLEACRRLYLPSCPTSGGRLPLTAYEEIAAHGPNFDVLAVAVGYNDVASVTATSFQHVVERARQFGYQRIVWWTLRTPTAGFADRNAVIRAELATGDYPDVVLADWGAYSAGMAHWFVADGVHFRPTGAWAAADYLTRKMAFLESRVCPVPTSPSAEPENPCPDPDVTGPVAAIEALYPIGGA